MRRISVGILAASSVVLTILLASCGTATPPVKPLTQAAAMQVASTGQIGDQLVASMIAPSGFSPMSVGAQALGVAGLQTQAACTITSSPASPVDGDSDGWYANATVTYNCSNSSGGTTYSITGSMTEQDKNDADPYSGTKATIKDLKITSTDSSGTSSLTENLTWDLTRNAPGDYALSYDFRIDVSDSSGSASFEVQGTPTYTADPGTTNPFDAGTFTFDGKVTLQDSDGTYELTRKSSGVHYSNACGGFDSGTVNYKDTAGNTMAITYTGCNSFGLTYNGSTVY